MRIIAAGWRQYADPAPPERALDWLYLCAWSAGEALTVVHGDGRGLDQIVKRWAQRHPSAGLVDQVPVPAKWARFGIRAGTLRNEQMWLEHYAGTDLCLALPGPVGISTGTRHCMALARQYDCPVWEIPWGSDWSEPPPFRLTPRT